MLVWMAVLGAVLGGTLGGLDDGMFLMGGVFGLAFGWILRRALRHEVATATAALRAELAMLRADMPAGFDGRRASARPDAPIARADSASPVPPRIAVPPPRAVEAAAAMVPAEPEPASRLASLLGRGIAAARGWLFGGNLIVRLGLVILFVGLSFLASYAAAAGLFPIELRLAVVGLFGIVLLGIGVRSRSTRPDFALALQGGAVAILYLTIFGAARLYDLVPMPAAFVLMIAVCTLGCALALMQRSQALAVTAFAGGFAVPVLLGGDSGSALGLFGYGTILNIAILVIARTRTRTWRLLNLLGFGATFGIATLWGATAYRSDLYPVAQIFLIVSVLIYVATAMLYGRASPGRSGQMVDTILLFGPALTGFGLQVALVGDRPFGSAFAALGFAALYLTVTVVAMRRRSSGQRLLHEAMLAIGIGFVTMAVPLALGARWTSAAWALEGAGAFWIGARQARWVPRLLGLLLQTVATLLYLGNLDDNVAALPLANAAFTGAILIALGWFATAWFARAPIPPGETWLARRYAHGEARIARPAFLIGFLLWWTGWLMEATRAAPPAEQGMMPVPVFSGGLAILLAMLAYLVSAALFQRVAQRRDWPVAAWPARIGVAALWLGFVAGVIGGYPVLRFPKGLLWLVAAAIHGGMLYQSDRARAAGPRRLMRAGHVGGVWLATALLADMLWWGIDRATLAGTAWSAVAPPAGAVAVLAALTLWAGPVLTGRRPAARWPLDRHAVAYGWIAAAPIAALVFAGALLVALFSSGKSDPLPFLPLLNPADLLVALAVAVLVLWRGTVLAAGIRGADPLARRGWWVAIAALGFAAANGAWLRTAHQLGEIAWGADPLFDSAVVQTGIAILWTGIALATMVVAHRRGRRALWLAGAGLLAATVVKLLIVDLNATGGGARIIAFIAVGMLMLLVGYLAPLPPATMSAENPYDGVTT